MGSLFEIWRPTTILVTQMFRVSYFESELNGCIHSFIAVPIWKARAESLISSFSCFTSFNPDSPLSINFTLKSWRVLKCDREEISSRKGIVREMSLPLSAHYASEKIGTDPTAIGERQERPDFFEFHFSCSSFPRHPFPLPGFCMRCALTR